MSPQNSMFGDLRQCDVRICRARSRTGSLRTTSPKPMHAHCLTACSILPYYKPSRAAGLCRAKDITDRVSLLQRASRAWRWTGPGRGDVASPRRRLVQDPIGTWVLRSGRSRRVGDPEGLACVGGGATAHGICICRAQAANVVAGEQR